VVEQWAWQLLRRWGVVFRDLLAKEPGAPSWYELSQVYRRLEARGEIRGGRFIAGVGGEQFGTGDTVRQLRALRDEASPPGELLTISAADPLNLAGIVTDHARVASTAANRVAYRDGAPIAALKSGQISWLAEVSDDVTDAVKAIFGPGAFDADHTLRLVSPTSAIQ
jgi:ATP-dependent Lhr-like helicase